MRHAYMYHGGFETNFGSLQAGATSFKGSDGKEHAIPPWPSDVDGARVAYMEKPGKHFYAVRLVDSKADIVLRNPVLIDPHQHMGMGKRFGPDATVVGDEVMLAFLKQAGQANLDQQREIEGMRDRIKADVRMKEAQAKK
jgi:hypothetical protein